MANVEMTRGAEIMLGQLNDYERGVVEATIERVAQAPAMPIDWRVPGLDGVYVAAAGEFRVVYRVLSGDLVEVQDVTTQSRIDAYRRSA